MLSRVACEELTEEVSFRQRLKGDERLSHAGIWRRNDPGKGENKFLKDPQGGSMPGMLKTITTIKTHIQGAQYSLSRASTAQVTIKTFERGRPVRSSGHCEDLSFSSERQGKPL